MHTYTYTYTRASSINTHRHDKGSEIFSVIVKHSLESNITKFIHCTICHDMPLLESKEETITKFFGFLNLIVFCI